MLVFLAARAKAGAPILGAYGDAVDPLNEFRESLSAEAPSSDLSDYRLEDEKFTLYSIGVNGTDDGGQAAFKEVRDGKTWQRDEGDWVWSYPEATKR